MLKHFLLIFCFCIFLLSNSFSLQAAGLPKQVVPEINRQVSFILAQPSATNEKRQELIGNLVKNYYDFDAFYQIILQDFLGEWDETQLKSFASRFEVMFLQNLGRQLDKLTLRKIVYKPGRSQVTADHAIQEYFTTAEGHKAEFKIFLIKRGSEWKIYDVGIDDALLSRNYRAQFNKIIRNENYSGLIARLDGKLSQNGVENENKKLP